MILDHLKSMDLHLDYPAGAVVETLCLEDVGAAMYPCYYMRCGARLKVAASVTALILDSGTFEPDRMFRPPDYFRPPSRSTYAQKNLLERLAIKIANIPVKFLRRLGLADPLYSSWYVTWHTADRRVKKLKAFERVTPRGHRVNFTPDFTLRDRSRVMELAVQHLRTFIRDMEMRFPEHHHVVLTGGMDGQLIIVAPKVNPRMWNVFSAEPNFGIIRDWLQSNQLAIDQLIRHDNLNDETANDFERKIVCGDLYCNPGDIRWLPALEKIAQGFGGKCIFWSGTLGELCRYYYPYNKTHFGHDYFQYHFTRAAFWQGTCHQTIKNYTGCALLSPYHTESIWREVFSHLDPDSHKVDDPDPRPQMGEMLAGRPLIWPTENPGPGAYKYNHYVDCERVYRDYIKNHLRYAG
jgi:hypothetical protein